MGKFPHKSAHSRKPDKNKFKIIDKDSNVFVTSPSKESSNNDINSDFKCDFDSESNDKYFEFFRKFEDLKKENSELSLNYENFEKRINLLKQNLEESENNSKIEKIDFHKGISKMQNLLMNSDVTIEELESEIVTIKSERDTFSNELTCAQNKLSMSEKSNFELEKKVVILNKEISVLKQKLDVSNNKPNVDVVNANDNSMNFTSFSTTFNDCDIFANDFSFEFTDDELYDYEGNSELSFEEKFRDLLKDMVLKRKENSNFSYKVNDLEKEVIFLKKCLGESEKKLKIQKFVFEDELKNLQNKCLSSEKNVELQRIEFLEKLKNSQCKFLACDKTRKDLEKKMNVLTSELENYKSISHQFTNGSQGLDKLLNIGKSSKDRSGLGFDKTANIPSTSQTTFVKASKRVEISNVSKEKLASKNSSVQNPRPSVHESNKDKCASSRTTSKKFIPICHHCGFVGHIRPKCFKLLNDQSYVQLGASNRFHVSNEKFVSKNSNFQKPSPNVFEKQKAKFHTNRISHQRFVPKCHHCGEKGHIRPRCYKLCNLNANFKMNLADKVDMLMCEVERLRKPRAKYFSIDLHDTKRMANNTMWVRKERSDFKTAPISKLNDFSGFKILKRGDGFQRLN